MRRFGMAVLTSAFLLSGAAVRRAQAATPHNSVLVAKAKPSKAKARSNGKTKKAAAPGDGDDVKGDAEPGPEATGSPASASEAPMAEAAPERRAAAEPVRAGGRAAKVTALAGVNTRTRWSDVMFLDGSRHYARNWIYPELSARALVRPWVAEANALRNLLFEGELARSIGASASSDTTGAGSFDVSSWRLAAGAAYLLERMAGSAWDGGAQLGLGVDRFYIDQNNPDYVVSNRLVFLRLGLLARMRLPGERMFVDVAAGYRLLLATGLQGRGANYSDTSGAYGFDVGGGLSGEWGGGAMRLAYALRLTYQRHAADIADSNATSFSQNDLLASAQVGLSFR